MPRRPGSGAAQVVASEQSRQDYYDSLWNGLNTSGLDQKDIDYINGIRNQKFSPTFFQKLGMAFGDYSAENQFYNEKFNSANEYVASIRERMRADQYNTSAAAAARDRAAGLNPDLNGISGQGDTEPVGIEESPENAYNSDSDIPGLVSAAASVAGIVAGIPAGVSGILASGLSLIQGIQDIKGSVIENDWKDIEHLLTNYPKLVDYVAGSSDTPYKDPVTGEDVVPLEGAQTAAISGILSPSAEKRLRRLTGSIKYDSNGNPTNALQTRRQQIRTLGLAAGAEEVQIASTPGFTENVAAWSENYMKLRGNLTISVVDAQLRCQKAIAEYDLKMHSSEMSQADYDAQLAALGAADDMAKYNREYYGKLDPDAIAGLQNDDARTKVVQNAQARMESEIIQATEKFYADALADIDNRDIPAAQKHSLRVGILEQRNEWRAQLAGVQAAEIAKGNKSLGATDFVDMAKFGVETGVDIAGKVLTSKAGKRNSKRKKSSRYGN